MTTPTTPSLPLTVHIGEGVHDLLAEWRDELVAWAKRESECTDYQALVHHQRELANAEFSLLSSLLQVMRTSNHDGDTLQLSRDGTTGGLFFAYEKSGYHGGIVRHEGTDLTPARYQVHT